MGPQELPPGLEPSGGGTTLPGTQLPPSPIDFSGAFQALFDFFSDPGSFDFLSNLLAFGIVILSFFSLFCMLMIIYIVIERNRLLVHEAKTYLPLSRNKKSESDEGDHTTSLNDETAEEGGQKMTAFDQVRDHMDTDNPAEWRIAIIEADNILYKILDRAGYEGETLGEMLTNATHANFGTLESAWEAHKIRNKVAHEGQELTLDKREARRVIGLYENVLREFAYL